jgi:serine/threonine protein phosphatase PrpC
MSSQPIDWGIATLTLEGQTESGDLHVVKPFPNGILVAVVDGLGHGEEAAAAARIAIATLEGSAHKPVVPLIQRCHEALMKTRGVVLSLASFNVSNETMTWVGVGNVEGVLLHVAPQASPVHEFVPQRGGVAGYRLPSLHPTTLSVTGGDTLIFATDGIRSGFVEELSLSDPPQYIADLILTRHGKGTDDALVLVARWNGRKVEDGRQEAHT